MFGIAVYANNGSYKIYVFNNKSEYEHLELFYKTLFDKSNVLRWNPKKKTKNEAEKQLIRILMFKGILYNPGIASGSAIIRKFKEFWKPDCNWESLLSEEL